MNFFLKTLFLLLLVSNFACSQAKVITYKVANNETIDQISKKYNVTPQEIYKLNPDAQKGLKPNMVLMIPDHSKPKPAIVAPAKSTAAATPITHEVLPKETIYAIIKKYSITEDDLMAANPFLKDGGLQTGQILTIATQKSVKPAVIAKETPVYHIIAPKETKYSISKQYGVTIEELEKRNPDIVSNFSVGTKLLIKGGVTKEITKPVQTPTKTTTPAPVKQNQTPTPAKTTTPTPVKENNVTKPVTNTVAKPTNYVDYEVKSSETLFGLSKMFSISQEELIAQNPVLKDGVTVGMIIKVPKIKNPVVEVKKEYGLLTKSITQGNRKRLAILLPFNMPNIEGDTLNSTVSRLKKDKFLNITLDFYSGVMMAIDSAKVLGLPIDVEIYDSQETKSSSSVAEIIQKNNLQNAHALLGPFYQSNAEVAALLLKEANVPVISPLSKDVGKPYRNLFQTVPSPETVRNTMFEFMRANNGNIIAVIDPKKESIVKYIKENQKGVSFVAFKENNVVSVESFKSFLVKGKTNFVILETSSTLMIKATLAMMLNVKNDYDVQLVVLDANDALDGDEIKFDNLVKLKLMYPSVTRENVSNEALIFDKNFKNNNSIYPSGYATRGFDVAFDTMMRLAQDVKFEETVNTIATKQIDNQFEYYKKEEGGYTNKGVFILYYDTDLAIKEAK